MHSGFVPKSWLVIIFHQEKFEDYFFNISDQAIPSPLSHADFIHYKAGNTVMVSHN